MQESQHRRWTLLAMCVSTFMISLDLTIVNVALPMMQRELHMAPGDLEWVISAYSLSLAAFVPVGGALGDRFGRKRLFLIGMAVFALGSIACALSWSGGALIASRAVQGIGGAAMLALTLSIITETFPSATRAGAIGTWAAIGGTGFGAGPVAGGILLTYFGWASVFWVNIPFAVIGIVGTAAAVRESRNPQSRRLDLPGLATSAAGLVAVTLGLIESASHPWGSWPVAAPTGRRRDVPRRLRLVGAPRPASHGPAGAAASAQFRQRLGDLPVQLSRDERRAVLRDAALPGRERLVGAADRPVLAVHERPVPADGPVRRPPRPSLPSQVPSSRSDASSRPPGCSR